MNEDYSYLLLFKRFKSWEWYKNPNMVLLFINLLISANFKLNKWQGIEVMKGELITTLEKLHFETGLSIKVIRNGLKRLSKSGEINIKRADRFHHITICKYEFYQDCKFKEGNERATEGQIEGNEKATEGQIEGNTINNNNKENKLNKVNKDNKHTPVLAEKIKVKELVFLSQEEITKLTTNLGEEKYLRCIEKLDNYKGAHDKKYKSDFRAILQWVVGAVDEDDRKRQKSENLRLITPKNNTEPPPPDFANNPKYKPKFKLDTRVG